MLVEGTIIGSAMLTKRLSETPVAELFQALHVESGERLLTKVSLPAWQGLPGIAGFEFRPGMAYPWHPSPGEILEREVELLKRVQQLPLALPRVVESGEFDGLVYASFTFFEGESLESYLKGGVKPPIAPMVDLVREVNVLHAHGLFHGNLTPSSVLVGEHKVLLLDMMMPMAEFNDAERRTLARCLTDTEYYPLLDPRLDHMALGILLYLIATARHPLTETARAPDRAPRPVRRAGPRFKQLIDEARERGANRYLSPLLSFVHPSTLRKKIRAELEEIVLKTIGLNRENVGTTLEAVEVIPDTWLETWPDVWQEGLDSIWGLKDAERALSLLGSRQKESAAGGTSKAPAGQTAAD